MTYSVSSGAQNHNSFNQSIDLRQITSDRKYTTIADRNIALLLPVNVNHLNYLIS